MKSLIVILVFLAASSDAQLLNLNLIGDLLNAIIGLLAPLLLEVLQLLTNLGLALENLGPLLEALGPVLSDLIEALNALLQGLGIASLDSQRSVNNCQEHLDALNRVHDQALSAADSCKEALLLETDSLKKLTLDTERNRDAVIEKTRVKLNACGTKSDSWSCLSDAFQSGINETLLLAIPLRTKLQKYYAAERDAFACVTKVQDDAVISANVNYQNAVQCHYRTNNQTIENSPRSL